MERWLEDELCLNGIEGEWNSKRWRKRKATEFTVEKVSPNSSPETSPNEHFRGNGETLHSGERAVEKVS